MLAENSTKRKAILDHFTKPATESHAWLVSVIKESSMRHSDRSGGRGITLWSLLCEIDSLFLDDGKAVFGDMNRSGHRVYGVGSDILCVIKSCHIGINVHYCDVDCDWQCITIETKGY